MELFPPWPIPSLLSDVTECRVQKRCTELALADWLPHTTERGAHIWPWEGAARVEREGMLCMSDKQHMRTPTACLLGGSQLLWRLRMNFTSQDLCPVQSPPFGLRPWACLNQQAACRRREAVQVLKLSLKNAWKLLLLYSQSPGLLLSERLTTLL